MFAYLMSNWKCCEDKQQKTFLLFSEHWHQKQFQWFAANQSLFAVQHELEKLIGHGHVAAFCFRSCMTKSKR